MSEIPSIGVEPILIYSVEVPVVNVPNVPISTPIGFPIIKIHLG